MQASLQEFCLMQPNCQDWYMFHSRREPRKGCCKEAGTVPVLRGIKVRLWKQMTTSEIRSTWLSRASDGPGETVWGGGGRLRSRQGKDTHSNKEESRSPARDTGMELPLPCLPHRSHLHGHTWLHFCSVIRLPWFCVLQLVMSSLCVLFHHTS